MEALTTQNSELRTMLIKATEVKPVSNSGANSEEKTSNPRDEIVSWDCQAVFAAGGLYGT